jgi:uncharacterized protein (DUF433 family)
MLARMSVASMLDREVYTYPEVDRLIGLHGGTAKRWINGYERAGTVHEPILRIMPRDTPWVTWGEFVEVRMLAEFRDIKEVPTRRLRGAIDSLRRRYRRDYPLAHLKPYLDVHDRDLTIGGIEVGLPDEEIVVRTGQALLGDAKWLADVAVLDHDDEGEQIIAQLPADKDFPGIVINPARLSGQPTFLGSRVSPVTIAGMARGGVPPEDLAADYGLSLKQVQHAIDYTDKYRLAAA